MLDENKTLVRAFLKKGNQEKRTPVELCAAGFTAYISGYAPMDLTAFQAYQTAFFASFSDTNATLEDLVAEGDRVAFRGYVETTHTDEFMGVLGSGKTIRVAIFGIAQIVEGKILNWWNAPDRLSWMQQIGAIPSP